MKLRVWWNRNFKGNKFYSVSTIKEAIKKINSLTNKDLKNPLVTDNVGGLEIFEDNAWSEYYNEDDNGIMEIIDNN